MTIDPANSDLPTCFGEITNSLKKLIYNLTTPTVSYEYPVVTTAGSTVTGVTSRNISSVSEVTETIFVYKGTLAANPIIAVFNGDEFPSSVTLASTISANSSMLTSILTTSKTSIAGPTPSVTSSPSGEQGILSSKAKAGIGVGVVLGVCAMLALSFLFYRSRKRKKPGDRSTSGGERPISNNMQMKTVELSNDAMRDYELPDSSRQELEEHHAVAEAHDQS